MAHSDIVSFIFHRHSAWCFTCSFIQMAYMDTWMVHIYHVFTNCLGHVRQHRHSYPNYWTKADY